MLVHFERHSLGKYNIQNNRGCKDRESYYLSLEVSYNHAQHCYLSFLESKYYTSQTLLCTQFH